MESPEKVATPLTALMVVTPPSAPAEGLFPIATVTGPLNTVARAPSSLSTRTTGCVVNGWPARPQPGWVLNERMAGT